MGKREAHAEEEGKHQEEEHESLVKMDLGCIKTNIMWLTESIMLFHREAFPMSYQFAGCALIRQQLSPLSNKKWARVKVKYKRLVISYTRPLSTIAIIARRTFLLFSVQSYRSFPCTFPVAVPQTDKMSYVAFYWWRNF